MGLSERAALVAALVFAVHPMRVESVAWVTERKDVLFGAFYVGALLFYWDYLKSFRGSYYAAAFLCASASILAKPMALSLPLVLFLFDRMAQRRWTLWALADKLPFMFALWPVAAITGILNMRTTVGTSRLLEAILIGVYSATFYVSKFFWPDGLAIIYPVSRPVGLGIPEYFWALLFLVGIVLLIWAFRRNRWIVFSFSFYFLSMFFPRNSLQKILE